MEGSADIVTLKVTQNIAQDCNCMTQAFEVANLTA